MKKAQNPLFIRVLGNFPFLCRKHNSRCEELGKSVADGKELLATTISEYVDTASDSTWDVINANMNEAFKKNGFTFIGPQSIEYVYGYKSNGDNYKLYDPMNNDHINKYEYSVKFIKILQIDMSKESSSICIPESEIGYDCIDVSRFIIARLIYFDHGAYDLIKDTGFVDLSIPQIWYDAGLNRFHVEVHSTNDLDGKKIRIIISNSIGGENARLYGSNTSMGHGNINGGAIICALFYITDMTLIE